MTEYTVEFESDKLSNYTVEADDPVAAVHNALAKMPAYHRTVHPGMAFVDGNGKEFVVQPQTKWVVVEGPDGDGDE